MSFGWLRSRKSEQDLLGLDIASGIIKLVEIQDKQPIHVLRNLAVAVLPAEAVIKNEIKDVSIISQALDDLLQQENIKTKNVAIAVPRSTVTVKMITVDKRLTTREIESRAWIEANRQFPELIGGIYLDYQILGVSAVDPNQYDLMLVACRKEHIDPYLEILKSSHLTPALVDVSSYALRRATSLLIAEMNDLNTIALLNLDMATSSLVVMHNKEMIYAHDHSFEGERLLLKAKEFLNNLSPELKVMQSRVEVLENSATQINPLLQGNDVPRTESVAEKPARPLQESIPEMNADHPAYFEILSENLIAQLRHVMHFFYSSRPNILIQRLILSGDCVVLPKLAAFVQKEIGIETQIANLFSNMEIASTITPEKLQRSGPTVMLASGLSVRSDDYINLLPWREQQRQAHKKQFSMNIASFMFLTFGLVIAIHMYLSHLITNQNNLNTVLQTHIAGEQVALTTLQKKKEEAITFKNKIVFLMNLQKNNNHAVRMLEEFARVTPSTVALSKLVAEGDAIIVEGVAQTELDITLFMQKIANSEYFTVPVLTEISSKNTENESEKKFQLKLKQRA